MVDYTSTITKTIDTACSSIVLNHDSRKYIQSYYDQLHAVIIQNGFTDLVAHTLAVSKLSTVFGHIKVKKALEGMPTLN